VIRRRALIRGIVQGVGFRPHVARQAARFPITGFCGNDDEQVFVEAQGEPDAVAAFLAAVESEAPPLARITSVSVSDLAVKGEAGFAIVASQRRPGAVTLIPPDVAACADCLADMADPANRRYRYPFTTCTNCGPRLSIIRDVPYDRPNTTMAAFPLCAACAREYSDPLDRRYHAQPVSCFDCGPRLWLEPGDRPAEWSREVADGVIGEARRRLAAGEIVAVKGIGGYTLFCDARNEAAVARLRERKHRPGKPFAVMASDLAAAGAIADFSPEQAAALTAPERPIVLIHQGAGYDLAPSVAPGLDDVGVMLPSAPLHFLLVEGSEVYVATSANLSGEPLAYDLDEARARLAGIVDSFLTHDRGIFVPVEDSVLMADGGGVLPVRRSRGFAPLPIRLGERDAAVLAVGGELKNTFALTRDGVAFLSAHIGDMESLESQRAFDRSVAQLTAMHRRVPDLVVADLHPSYATTAWAERYAERTGAGLLRVQHHHAHALSLVAEHGLVGVPLTVITVDGTGYGLDGTVWGGEILTLDADPRSFERVWSLPGFWLPGGDSAVKHPWKCAAALLWELALGPDAAAGPIPGSGSAGPGMTRDNKPDAAVAGWRAEIAAGVSEPERAFVQWQLETGTGVIRTTSAGRLFDAVASLLGVRHHVTYEAQAAMELETLARTCPHQSHDDLTAPAAPVTALVTTLLASPLPTPCRARQFHDGLGRLLAEAAFQRSGDGVIGLTGGVAANRLLTAAIARTVTRLGGRLVTHRLVPANDGGLSLGQALAGYLEVTQGGLR
jgi:hydrogenase maturation protein HypF